MLDYAVRAAPRGLVGRLAVPLQIGVLFRRSFGRTFQRYGELARDGRLEVATAGSSTIDRAGARRLEQGVAALVAAGERPELVEALAATIRTDDDVAVAALRPKELAHRWGVAADAVLDLCLAATRAGLLALRWDVICPQCTTPRLRAGALSALGPTVHCDTCGIDYETDFASSVELTFRVDPSVRDVPDPEAYCIGGPSATPLVVAQHLLGVGEAIDLALPVEGAYRLRVHGRPGGALLRRTRPGAGADATGEVAPAVVALGAGPWPAGEQSSAAGVVAVTNGTGAECLAVLDRVARRDDAVTGTEVIARQRFRDLFAAEALRPDARISVGRVAIGFTDLQGSTRFYREAGDAVAFGEVLDHFDVIHDLVAAAGGSVVKTIGDAVMVVFRSPADALEALLAAQAVLADPDRRRPLPLRVGLHCGPAIAVTLNDRLDYFGTTVNLAARLEPLGGSEGAVVTAEVLDDPEVEAALAAGRLAAAPLVHEVAGALKGFEDSAPELVVVRRVVPTG